eukprot:TRINITY_DN2828_c0_g1_i1.p1 TRINITY_DN2828_c0_g1~~TRINITY_DN2828_c0_g1_i1.p1  ORF type:complete len:511 (+),score=109.58 TRINITY_DN2828_c0_g1_i1:160-1692(+)
MASMAYDGYQKRSQKGPPQGYGGYGGYRGQGSAWMPPQGGQQHSPYGAPPHPPQSQLRKSHMHRSAPPMQGGHHGPHQGGYRWGPPPPPPHQRSPPPSHFQHPPRQPPPPNSNSDWDFGRLPPRSPYSSTPLNPNAPTYNRVMDTNPQHPLSSTPAGFVPKTPDTKDSTVGQSTGSNSPLAANSPSTKTESSAIIELPADVSWGDLQDDEDDEIFSSNPPQGGSNSFSSTMGTPLKASFAQPSSPTTPSAVIDVSTPPGASLKPVTPSANALNSTPVRQVSVPEEEDRTGWSRKGSPKATPKKGGVQPAVVNEGGEVDATVAALRAKMADKKKVVPSPLQISVAEGETVKKGQHSVGVPDICIHSTGGTVHIADVVDNAFIKNCSDSQIFIAAAKGLITIENCKNCDITCASQKLQIASSDSCRIRLFLSEGSPTLDEKSRDLSMGRFVVSCPSIFDLFSQAGLNPKSSGFSFPAPSGVTFEDSQELLQITIPDGAESQTIGNLEEARQG